MDNYCTSPQNSYPPNLSRRPLIAVIGATAVKDSEPAFILGIDLGRCLIDAGFRVCSGGLGGVMTAVFKGAQQSRFYREGDTVAIIPSLEHQDANEFSDIVICTGMGYLRNGIVAASQAVIVVGGASGTLSEAALAWQYGRLIVALSPSGGTAKQLAGTALDTRKNRQRHIALTVIQDVQTPRAAVDCVRHYLSDIST